MVIVKMRTLLRRTSYARRGTTTCQHLWKNGRNTLSAREDRNRHIGMLVMRWRRVKPEAMREANALCEVAATRYSLREEAPVLVQDEPEPLDPWIERAQRLRPQWMNVQQAALARMHTTRAE